jgi:Tfp pilus assembly protein PilV
VSPVLVVLLVIIALLALLGIAVTVSYNRFVLSKAVTAVMLVAENYPQLRASENYLALQAELVDTADRIVAGRRFYNGNVRALSVRVDSVPSNLIASRFHFTAATYFPQMMQWLLSIDAPASGSSGPTCSSPTRVGCSSTTSSRG